MRGVESLHADNGTERILPKIEDALDLIEAEIPIPRELVKGVLHQGSKLALGGSSKAYKTWLLIDLAVSVATGLPWLGFETAAMRVLYINLEIQRPFFRRRLRRICRRRGVRLFPGVLDVWNLRGWEISIAEIKEKLEAWARPGDYALIVIDPIYKTFLGRDENSTGEIKGVLNAVEQIARSLNCAVAWAAHFSKGNQADKEAIDRISGSGVWGRDPDSILTFTRHEEEEAFIVQLTLRDFPPLSDFAVKFDDGLLVRDDALDPTKFKKPKSGRPSQYKPEDLAEVLGGDDLPTKDFLKRVKDETGMTKDTFFRLRKIAEDQKIISFDKVSKTWERILKRV